MRVGLISDTHGLLRPEALRYLAGSDLIIHGGDIGAPTVLEALEAIAPVTAVRGNNDVEAWAARIPEARTLDLAGVRIHVIHDLAALPNDPAVEGVHVVVSGHSHQPRVFERGGVLYVNPGSAGPRRFKLPISAGELRICAGRVQAGLETLSPTAAK